MKYYAVADDPNELLHYGRLGMKWGQHIFVGTKSLSYKKAEGKLRSKIQNTKTSIKKSLTQRAVNRQQRQQEKFAKAVQKTQQRIALTEGFRDMDRLKAYERSDNRAFKQAYKAAKIADKNARAEARNELHYANNERKMEKYTQQAREGKLKYGKLSSDQVNQITNRLAIEANARRLGSAEKTWHQQKKEAFRSGKLEGIKRGTAAAMEEVARAGAIYGIKNIRNRMKLNADAKQQGKEEKLRTRAKNRRTHGEIRQDLKDQAYELRQQVNSNIGREIQNLEAEKDLRKKVAQAYYMNKSDAGKALAELEAQKALRDADTKHMLETDSSWKKHIADGGSTTYMDKNNNVYDLSDKGSLAKTDPKRLTELRQQKMESDKKAKEQKEEAENKAAYNKMVEDLKREDRNTQLIEGRKQQQRMYESAIQNWIKNGRSSSNKPHRSDFGSDDDIHILPPPNYPTYEEYKKRTKAGLPGLPSRSYGSGGGKKGGNNG